MDIAQSPERIEGPTTTPRKQRKSNAIPLSAAMMLVTLGVVYGDIGTSPLYVMKAIMADNGGLPTMIEDTVLGALSLVIWTITLITTVKYVLIAMKADNHNEGGIFALYSLVKRCGRWLILPAMIGGAALLADGILTPAVTVTTAIEGLRTIELGQRIIGDSQGVVIAITVSIISALFFMQRAGTSSIGKLFGPIMCLWFGFLGTVGIIHLFGNLGVLRAFNPLRGIAFLFDGNINRAGLMVLGNVFLCTTGAEALYSDMGHVGKSNVYATWPVVKACLILNYLGQGAWILANTGSAELAQINDLNPFFQMLPEGMRPFAVILSTLAAIIASQALITGSYSIVSEATRLDLMPHLRVTYPSQTKGQLYIPAVNNVLWVGCILVVLYFRSSSRMESAYGLAITLTMLMTSILLTVYLARIRKQTWAAVPFALFFGAIELMFFFASLTKFTHGGYVTVMMSLVIFYIMFVWRRGTAIERTQSVYLPVNDYLEQLERLSADERYEYVADNLVYLTNDSTPDKIDRDILYSILDRHPRRARAYWFVNVNVTDEPFTCTYTVNDFSEGTVFKVRMDLGFKVNQNVSAYMRQIISDLMETGELPAQPHEYSTYKDPGRVGSMRYVILRRVLAPDTDISARDWRTLQAKYAIRRVSGNPAIWFGVQHHMVENEYVPLFARMKEAPKLERLPFVPAEEGSAKRGAANAAALMGMRDSLFADASADEDDDEDIFSADVAAEKVEMAQKAQETLIGGETAQFRALVVDEVVDENENDIEDAVDALMDEITRGN